MEALKNTLRNQQILQDDSSQNYQQSAMMQFYMQQQHKQEDIKSENNFMMFPQSEGERVEMNKLQIIVKQYLQSVDRIYNKPHEDKLKIKNIFKQCLRDSKNMRLFGINLNEISKTLMRNFQKWQYRQRQKTKQCKDPILIDADDSNEQVDEDNEFSKQMEEVVDVYYGNLAKQPIEKNDQQRVSGGIQYQYQDFSEDHSIVEQNNQATVLKNTISNPYIIQQQIPVGRNKHYCSSCQVEFLDFTEKEKRLDEEINNLQNSIKLENLQSQSFLSEMTSKINSQKATTIFENHMQRFSKKNIQFKNKISQSLNQPNVSNQ